MKKVLITGASSEIGRAISDFFYNAGFSLVLQCNKNDQNLKSYTRNTEIIKSDFTNEFELNNFISKIENIDVLVYAAAITKTNLVTMLTEYELQQMVSVNILAFSKITQAVLQGMIKKRNGIIIGISSVAASRVNRGQSIYGGTKAYMETFIRSIACEWSTKGIRANSVAPGAINAGSFKDLMNQAEDEIKDSIAMKKTGTPLDVAETVFYLADEKSKFINGQTIHVDGGFLRGL